MDPSVDAAMLNDLSEPGNSRYKDLLESSRQPSENLITWEESINLNMKEHLSLIKENQVSINKVLELFA
ncbi:hypothetical protein PG5_65360 [Pseudomonas sp. G5(2012)]|nr:hypothetical protein PG5_65360 [Pseudomonas sp. G5(2012)]